MNSQVVSPHMHRFLLTLGHVWNSFAYKFGFPGSLIFSFSNHLSMAFSALYPMP